MTGATIRRGSTGADVSAWQGFLRSQGYSAVDVDGAFGPVTDEATKAFQRSQGLAADGIVGAATRLAAARIIATIPDNDNAAPTTPGRLTARGRELIKGFEGLRLTAYPDGKEPDGSPRYSVGYGHNGVPAGTVITRAEADRYFDADVERFERAVAAAVPRAEAHQFDALVSLAYNIGTAAFARSTVVTRHNAGDTHGAADAFLMWNQSGGKVLPVLERRREREREIYLHGYGAASSPAGSPASSPAGGKAGGSLALLLLLALGFALLREMK